MGVGKVLRRGFINMDVLVVLGILVLYFYFVCVFFYGVVIGFWFLIYFEISFMLIIFVLLGKYLEFLVKGRILDVIKKFVEFVFVIVLLFVKDKGIKICYI